MADCMTFPDTVEEFMEQYKIVDTEHVYTNGTEFVPIYRMKQWFEHLPPAQCNCKKINTIYGLDGTAYTQDKDKQGWTGHLSSAQLQQKKGKWILHQSKYGKDGEYVYTCDKCGENIGFIKKNFCPNCGADMRESESDD